MTHFQAIALVALADCIWAMHWAINTLSQSILDLI